MAGVLFVYYQIQSNSHELALAEKVEQFLNLQRKILQIYFSTIEGDLLFLAQEETLQKYLLHPSEPELSHLNSEYLTLSQNKKNYEQIRYLDDTGMEIVRVNHTAGKPICVYGEELQLKYDRYYFKDAFKLGAGDVFISPFDLNVEHGHVEIPYKPMIRFATPVFDSLGTKRGLVLINYLGQDLLDFFSKTNAGVRGETMLINRDGYWLLHPDANKAWGFMFENRRDVSFAREHPDVWEQIQSSFSGQIWTPQGLYVYATIIPLDFEMTSGAGLIESFDDTSQILKTARYYWKNIVFLSTESLSANFAGLRANLFRLGGILLLLGSFGLWPLAELVVRRRGYQEQLVTMAHFDTLTTLPNRTLFFDRLEQSLHLASRYGRISALLYLDLDGFKAVNDTLGHDAGDELLIEGARRMKECCRVSDTVARFGGDEFTIFLPEVASAEGAESLAQQILQVFDTPFELKKGRVSVGVIIGISLFPVHGKTSEELLKSADSAMYVSKKRGKNTVTIASPI